MYSLVTRTPTQQKFQYILPLLQMKKIDATMISNDKNLKLYSPWGFVILILSLLSINYSKLIYVDIFISESVTLNRLYSGKYSKKLYKWS